MNANLTQKAIGADDVFACLRKSRRILPRRKMEELIFHLVNVIAPVLLSVLTGFGLAKFGLPFDKKTIGALVANVGYPTLILSHLTEQHVALAPLFKMMLAALAAITCFGLIGFALLKLLRLPIRGYLSPMMLNNVGNVGLPVCALAFGDKGLSYALAIVAVYMVASFTVGIWLPSGKITFADLVKKPVIYAVVVALVMLGTETRLPGPLQHTFNIMGGMTIPLMLLTLGNSLATLRTGDFWRGARLALLHLVMAISVAFVLVHAFGFKDAARGVFILECVMPVAVTAYLWVEMYDPKDAPGVASLILVSTLLSVAILPLVLTIWI